MPGKLKAPSPGILAQFAGIVGVKGALTAPEDTAPYLQEWRDRYYGRTPMVLRPVEVAQVSAILKLAHDERIAIVPQGGNTGLVGGQIPFESGNEIVLSLDRMKAIRNVDAAGNSLTAEAGVTLQSVQDAAEAAGRLFPLSLGSEGTCQIGGNIATNAGGVQVLRYGNMRDLVLGIEAVFPGGETWNGLKSLRKDNTGYDLKSLLIGSEGTLGVIAAATLKLFPRPAEVTTVFAGCPSLEAVADLFNRAFESAGPLLTAFELMPRMLLDFQLAHMPQSRDPLAEAHPWYVLFEVSSPLPEGLAERVSMALLEGALEKGIVADAAVAASQAQAQEFWRMRESLPAVQKFEGCSIKHDVSVPVSSIPAFIHEANAAVAKLMPGARPVPFGHFGDGNIHYNVTQPIGMEAAAFLARWDEVADLVHGIVLRFGGSISAEHGIGRMKAKLLETVKSPVELALMYRIKAAFDPRGILNPGKLLAAYRPAG
ncbi:MAG: FAD-binding oxidoreductase [Rhodomicrobium sp.]|nr:FAD-binding oxidoreductase [Rhodomicrobium sp.]